MLIGTHTFAGEKCDRGDSPDDEAQKDNPAFSDHALRHRELLQLG